MIWLVTVSMYNDAVLSAVEVAFDPVDNSGLHLATVRYGNHSIFIYRDTYLDYDGECDGEPPNIQSALDAVGKVISELPKPSYPIES